MLDQVIAVMDIVMAWEKDWSQCLAMEGRGRGGEGSVDPEKDTEKRADCRGGLRLANPWTRSKLGDGWGWQCTHGGRNKCSVLSLRERAVWRAALGSNRKAQPCDCTCCCLYF